MRRSGARLRGTDHPRPAHALGELLGRAGDVIQLAAAAGACRGARLRGLARGLSPAGDGPLAPVLVAARAVLPGLPRSQGLAAEQRADARAVAGPAQAAVRAAARSAGDRCSKVVGI